MKILFICTGNTCRSPMAEALVRNKYPGTEVQSAGIFATENDHANPKTIKVLEEKKIEFNHRSQPVTNKLLLWADLVLTMTTQHKQSLILQFPSYQTKYYTLKEYASDADKLVWKELKKQYANYEEKRSQFIQENQHKLGNNQLEEALTTHVKDDIKKIRQLESNIIDYDISDPFGGDLNVYKKTLEELDNHISMLANKLNK